MKARRDDDLAPLDYAPKGLRQPINWLPLLTCALLASTILSLFIFLRIELLNDRAGKILPRTEVGKWRVTSASESSWRRTRSVYTNDPSILSRPLTTTEQNVMIAETTRERANGDLRDFVGTFGLLQYAIVPFALVLSITSLSNRRPRGIRILAMACLVCTICCAFGMIYREYFMSLER